MAVTGLAAALLSEARLRQHLLAATLITLGFALLAWRMRGVTASGAVAGFLTTWTLFLAGGPPMFAAVFVVFALTYIATRIGRQRKQLLHIAERNSGRNAAQVLANVGCAALAAVAAQLTPWHGAFFAGSIAALAEAAADTVSSETGKAFSQTARLITSWKTVPVGTEGAISVPGTVLGTLATVIIGCEAAATGILSPRSALFAIIAAIAGMFVDSILGATLERRGYLTNNAVNLISTAFSAGASLLVR